MGEIKTVEHVVVHGYILSQTEKAIRFECHEINGLSLANEDGTHRREWFPISQCNRIHKEADKSKMDYIDVSKWILKKKEMI